jgi:hypothetical protein
VSNLEGRIPNRDAFCIYISLVLLYEESIEIIGLPVKEDKLLKSRIS